MKRLPLKSKRLFPAPPPFSSPLLPLTHASCVVTITSKFAALLVAQARVGHRLGEWGRLAARETGMRQLSRFRIETADVPRAVETTAAMVA